MDVRCTHRLLAPSGVSKSLCRSFDCRRPWSESLKRHKPTADSNKTSMAVLKLEVGGVLGFARKKKRY